MDISKRVSQSIYTLKALAVLSIICAHCNSVSDQHSAADIFAGRILGSFGSAGVGMFLLLAGFLMHGTKRTFKSFAKSKLTSLAIPWAFCGTLVYLYVHLRKGGIGPLGLAKWLIGMDTFLYYLTVLTVLYLLCFFVRHKKWVLYIYAVVSLISNLLTGLGLLDFLNHHLNPLNFLLFFVAGMLIGEYNAFEKVLDFCKKILPISLIVYNGALIVLTVFEIKVSYFVLFFIPVEILAILCMLGFSTILQNRSKIITNIGKLSFSIYLLHMPFAGIAAKLFGMIDFFGLTLLRPLVVLAVTYLFIVIVGFVAEKLRLKKVAETLMGMR